MRVWRVARHAHTQPSPDGKPANLLDGEGARRAGGRWNFPGTPVVYTSESIALAAMEVFVHMGAGYIPRDHAIISIEIPEALVKRAYIPNPLPERWDAKPESTLARNVGDAWLRERKTLLMRVPSVLVGEEFNYLINPAHRDIRKLTASILRGFQFDPRLFRLSK